MSGGKTRSHVYALILCHVFCVCLDLHMPQSLYLHIFCACIISTSMISLVLEVSFSPILSVFVIKVQIDRWLCPKSSSFFDSRLDLAIQNDDWKLESSCSFYYIQFPSDLPSLAFTLYTSIFGFRFLFDKVRTFLCEEAR